VVSSPPGRELGTFNPGMNPGPLGEGEEGGEPGPMQQANAGPSGGVPGCRAAHQHMDAAIGSRSPFERPPALRMCGHPGQRARQVNDVKLAPSVHVLVLVWSRDYRVQLAPHRTHDSRLRPNRPWRAHLMGWFTRYHGQLTNPPRPGAMESALLWSTVTTIARQP
jgi:hypothetical protein